LHNQDKDLALARAVEQAETKFTPLETIMRQEKVLVSLTGFTDTAKFREANLLIKKLLNSEKFIPYFEVIDGEVYLEKEIVDACGNTKRIDRLVVKQKEAVVIDYKSAKGLGESHREQISEYIKIIQDIYPRKKVKGVLIYLDDLSFDEIDG